MRKLSYGVFVTMIVVGLSLFLLGMFRMSAPKTHEAERKEVFQKVLPSTFMIQVFVGVPYPLAPELSDNESGQYLEFKDVAGKTYRLVMVATGSGCRIGASDRILTVKHLTAQPLNVVRVATEYGVVQMSDLRVFYLATDHNMQGFMSELFAEDEVEDLALLRVGSSNIPHLGPPARVSSRDVERYESVFTIGTPGAIPFIATEGFVNAPVVSLPPYGDRTQMTLLVAQGNSGGCVFRMGTGEVVGVVSEQSPFAPYVSYSPTLPAIRKFLESNLPKTAPETKGGHEAK